MACGRFCIFPVRRASERRRNTHETSKEPRRSFGRCRLSHDWQPATCTAPETCSKCGETQGEALGHTWVDADCVTPRTCSVCGETEGDPLGHDWVDATCTEPKTCSRCGETEGEALGHTWVDATCTTAKTCSVCGETEGEALGHTPVTDAAVEQALTTEGLTEGSHCSVCGEVLVQQETIPMYGQAIPAETYEKACACVLNEDYTYAAELFNSIETYEDSANWIKYCNGILKGEDGNYSYAISTFRSLGNFSNSSELLVKYQGLKNAQDYETAVALMESEKYAEAISKFELLGEYLDSSELLETCRASKNEADYLQALQLLSEGNYKKAYALFCTLGGYKDVDSLLATNANLQAERIRLACVKGEYISFGNYTWLVLDVQDTKALLICKSTIATLPYDEKGRATWESCSLREWLNNDFLNSAFSSAERKAILTTVIDNSGNGNDTKDKIFLLSTYEAKRYFKSDADRACGSWWWTRSTYKYDACAISDVGQTGVGDYCFHVDADFKAYGVRPAFWISFEASAY